MSTRVGVLDRGRLVLQEDMATISAVTGLVRVRTPDVGEAIALLDGRVQQRAEGEVVVKADDAAALNALLVGAGVRVSGLEPVRRTLEQVVLEATSP
jgi:hypothetical protein